MADAPSARPPSPDECAHPQPVEGVMAHEFAHYEGAVGPEGVRRTVTYYGPVIGGLPIAAWHCELCGLLKLAFPDGRSEERRLFPGPQPGLIAAPSSIAPERVMYGRQARVSGLTGPPSLLQRLAPEADVAAPLLPALPTITLPDWDATTWLMVLGLSGIAGVLFLMGVMAAAAYSTPSAETPLAIIVACTFVGLLLYRIGVAAVRHLFPAQPLRPSIAESARRTEPLDAATRTAVVLLALATIGLFACGILAVYTYSTPGAVLPVLLISLLLAVLAALIKLGSVATRRLGGP